MRCFLGIVSILATSWVPAAFGQVAVTYAPTTLEPGVATDVTVTLTDQSGDGLDITAVNVLITTDDMLSANSFRWLVDAFDDPILWFASETLPRPQAAAFAAGVMVDVDGSLDLAIVSVTADADSAGASLTLGVFPQGSDAVITDTGNFFELEIASGRTVQLAVADQASDDGSTGGGGGGGPIDDGSGASPGGDDGMTGDDGMADDDPMSGDDDTVGDPDSGGNGDAGDVVIDDGNDGGAPGDDGSGGGGSGVVDGDGGSGDNGNGSDAVGDAGGDDPIDGGADGGISDDGTPAPSMPLCGMGMIVPMLFTLGFLCVMKFRGTGWR